MKIKLFGMAATLALALTAQSAAAGCASSPPKDHTVVMHLFGFLPTHVHACPGDRVRFHNQNSYSLRMYTVIPGAAHNPNSDDGSNAYQDYTTGNLLHGQYSPWMTVGPNSGTEFRTELSDYNYSNPNDRHRGLLIVDAAPTEFGNLVTRYVDPPLD